MKLIIGGESMLGSRTGIGNYTYNLCQHLAENGHVEQFDLLVHGTLVPFKDFLQTNEGALSGSGNSAIAKLRGKLSRFSPAVWTYQRVMPLRERWVLRNQPRDVIFHSPNYFLPAFPGRKVVTIPDLSTWLHPEWHPKASATLINHHIDMARRKAEHIIAISHTVKQEIVDHLHVEEERISVTHLGASDGFQALSADEFQGTADATGLNHKGYFIFLSTLEPRKNLSRLLDAYLTYRREAGNQALPLVVCGHNGWKSSSEHRRLRELDAKGVVRYLGYTPPVLTRQLMAGARALVYPSLYEGFGLPVLEAMQSGTAVITSQNTAAAEISGKAALLIDPESCQQLETAFHQIHREPDKVHALEISGIERAQSFSWEATAGKTFSIYKRIAERA